MNKYHTLNANIRQSRLVSYRMANVIPDERHINGTWMLRYVTAMQQTGFGFSCSCTWAPVCKQLIGFYCSTPNCAAGNYRPPAIIPGFLADCDVLDFSQNTLECFYNPSCVQMLIDWRLYDVEGIYLPINLSNITALDVTTSNFYSPYHSIDGLGVAGLIEEKIITSNYTAYYDQCRPKACSYIIQRRAKVIVVITTVVGLIGGLTVILRLLVPSLTSIGRKVFSICRQRGISE
jgi:hypothetical protein